MNRKKVQHAGMVFGNICKHIGAVATIIGSIMTPNQDTLVNKGGVLLLCLAMCFFAYGSWRTGTIMLGDDKNDSP